MPVTNKAGEKRKEVFNMTRCKKNEAVKAFCAFLTAREKEMKRIQFQARYDEYRTMRKLTGQVNNRGEGFTVGDIMRICTSERRAGAGASKEVYIYGDLCIAKINPFSGWRNRENIDQILQQVALWNRIAETPDNIYFNPMLVYGAHRGDKVSKEDDRFKNVTFCVSQKCKTFDGGQVEFYEKETGRDFYTDFEETKKAGKKLGLYDDHGGNFGIMYNYDLHTYRIVWIDYGL